MSTLAPSTIRGRLQFILLATLFVGPFLASYIFYFYFPQSRPEGRTNYGELILPVQEAFALELKDANGQAQSERLFTRRWTLLTVADARCDEDCENHLLMSRQVRLALNEKRVRVQRALLLLDGDNLEAISERLSEAHPQLSIVALESGALPEPLKSLTQTDSLAFFIDPHGNWVMRYPVGRERQSDFKGMQKDIKKLLRLSQIG